MPSSEDGPSIASDGKRIVPTTINEKSLRRWAGGFTEKCVVKWAGLSLLLFRGERLENVPGAVEVLVAQRAAGNALAGFALRPQLDAG